MRRIRPGRRFFWVFPLLICTFSLFARGKQEEEEIRESQNTLFILCIAAFDVSALPPSQQVLGSVLQKDLALELSRIYYRQRSGEELARYEELAWAASLHEAASRLAAKREERDALLYRGVPDWKYRKELKRIEDELKELKAAFQKAESEYPLVAERALFRMSTVNTEGNFPPPPEPGGEEIFLRTHNADALLEGTFRLLYGRIYAEFRLFTRGASFVYKDTAIFSPEDLNAASDELKSRFLGALCNSEPARLTLRSEPDHARLEINGRTVQNGKTLELPPGPVIVRASAENHQSEVRELELEGGDAEEITFVLKPFTMEILGVTFPEPDSSVYMGALYLGGNPSETAETTGEARDTAEPEPGFFSVYIPAGQYRYIRVDTEDGLTGEAIVKGTPGSEVRIITLEPRRLPGKNERPVEDFRRKFYGAYGRFWIALPAAFFINGISQLYYNSYNMTSGNHGMYDSARYVSIGAWSLAGVFLVESLVRMGIYVHRASMESIPLWE
ncbi:MAG: hypothetical protein FWG27_02905 [Treponema sp.]|nr:hypothetical protein [Treponema sp.]